MEAFIIGLVPCGVNEKFLYGVHTNNMALVGYETFYSTLFSTPVDCVCYLLTPELFPGDKRAHHGFMDGYKNYCNTATESDT